MDLAEAIATEDETGLIWSDHRDLINPLPLEIAMPDMTAIRLD